MFKKIKEGISKIKELRKDPKKKDLISLGLWLLFFALLLIIVRIDFSGSNNKSIGNENKSINISNYEFTYVFENKKINGFYYNGDMLFYLNNNKYYVSDNVYLVDINNIILQEKYDLGAMKISYDFISKLTKDVNPVNNGEYETYSIPLDRFIALYDYDTGIDLSSAMNYNVIVDIYKNNGIVSKIKIDMSSYYLFNKKNTNYFVWIYFYNVNNVSNFTKEYKERLGVS